MIIQITGKNFELTDAIKNYVNEKIGGLEKYYDKITEARVELEKCAPRNNHNNFRVLVNFSVPGDLLRVDQTEDSIYTAIDCAREEMEMVVKKNKDKRVTKKKEANKTKRFIKSVFFWRNRAAKQEDSENEENE